MRASAKSKKKKDELVLVFDIGSASVGGAVFYAQKNGMPKIIYSTREIIPFEKEIDFDKFLSFTMKSLGIVAGRICLAGLGAPNKIFCVLLSPWSAFQTRTINFEKNTPFIFTAKLSDGLIKKEVKLFEEEYTIDVQNKNGIRLIELKNMKITLNGYATSKPLGQKAKELEMTLFISMSSKQFLEKIEETVGRHFHCQNLKYTSFGLASFSVARDMFAHQDNFLLVDIGGEVTDMAMVKKDILCSSISFPIGQNYLTRKVASALNCTLDEAKSYISLYKDKHMLESIGRKFEPMIDELKADWLKKFQESLADLANNLSVPSTIFLTVDKNLEDFFSEIIKDEEFSQYNLAETKFKIVFFGTQTLHGLAVFGENTIRDPFLTLESIYINRFLG
jgi:cell division ATPase FtsA